MKITKNLSTVIKDVRKVNRFAANWLSFAIKNGMLEEDSLIDDPTLLVAFDWESTPQGSLYWYEIHLEIVKNQY